MSGLSSFLSELAGAYGAGDLARFRAVYASGLRDPWLGPWVRLFDRAYPVRALLDLCVELDRRIGAEGLSLASRWLLDAWVPGWRGSVPASTAAVLATEPVLIYGNHPSMLTPFLVAGHVPRPDLRIVSASFVPHLLPSYAPYAFPVELPYGKAWRWLRRGGLAQVLITAALSRVHRGPPPEEAQARNRASLALAADHLRGGGAVLIAPGGGGSRERPWRPGIGRILLALADRPGERPVWLVPYRERGAGNREIRGALRRGRPLAPGRMPVEITFGEPLLLSDLGALPPDPLRVARRLQDRYRSVFSSLR